MTLTELSVFMKKQELDLQLRTEKEKEEGECLAPACWSVRGGRRLQSALALLLVTAGISKAHLTPQRFGGLGRILRKVSLLEGVWPKCMNVTGKVEAPWSGGLLSAES